MHEARRKKNTKYMPFTGKMKTGKKTRIRVYYNTQASSISIVYDMHSEALWTCERVANMNQRRNGEKNSRTATTATTTEQKTAERLGVHWTFGMMRSSQIYIYIVHTSFMFCSVLVVYGMEIWWCYIYRQMHSASSNCIFYIEWSRRILATCD